MIKIEKISADKATIVRGGLRQPLILHSHINDAELATIKAVSGTITYSIDETEVKELEFLAKPAETKLVTKQPAAKTTKLVVEPAAVKAVVI